MRRFAIGDIHGAYKALMQVLNKVNFDYDKDLLIGIGDYVDGWNESKEVVSELLKVKNFVGILGNHDEFAKRWILDYTSYRAPIWTTQGGEATIKSYGFEERPKGHKEFFQNLKYYYELDNMLFVHGGYNPQQPIENQYGQKLMWDRELFSNAFRLCYDMPISYDTVFIGHTTTEVLSNSLEPLFSDKVIAIDTGAGWSGRLTLMDIDTKEYVQSDICKSLYPNSRGRG